MALHQPGMPGHHFATQAAAFQDLLPLDMSSITGSDTSSNPGAPPVMHRQQHHRQQSGFQAQTPTTGALYKLDAMMFPSGDPFAYPTPLLDQTGGGGHHAVSGQPPPPIPAGSVGPTPGTAGPENMQLYMSGFYDDSSIEGQVLGPVAPYLMQHGGPEPNPHAGVLDPAAQMSYTTMLNLHLQHQQRQQQQQQQHGQDGRPGLGPGRGPGQQHPGMHQRHAHQQHQHQHPGLQHHQRHHQNDMVEGIFRGEWEDILGGGGPPPGAGYR